MIIELLTILGCYGLCVGLVHLKYGGFVWEADTEWATATSLGPDVISDSEAGTVFGTRVNSRSSSKISSSHSFVIATKNSECFIEHYMRSLMFWMRWHGRADMICVVDESSNDLTLDVARILGRNRWIKVLISSSAQETEACIRSLNNEGTKVVRLDRCGKASG